jgi:hypothetical protein
MKDSKTKDEESTLLTNTGLRNILSYILCDLLYLETSVSL